MPSGRYQARYRIDAKLVSAPTTFRTKRDAEAYLSTVRADMERGTWIDPIAGQVTLRDYATTWLDQRPDLRPRTVELYEGGLRLHILPVLGDLEMHLATFAGPAKTGLLFCGPRFSRCAGRAGPGRGTECSRQSGSRRTSNLAQRVFQAAT